MKSRLGIVLTMVAALGSTAFLIPGADAQPTPQAPASATEPTPPSGLGPCAGGPGAGMARFTPQDRAAFFKARFAARIAAIKVGLQLTAAQQKLWAPVEQAVRSLAKDMITVHEKIAKEGCASNPVEHIRRAADAATTRGKDLHKLADAAEPLWASLSDDQKRRLPELMRMVGGWNSMRADIVRHHRCWMPSRNDWQEPWRPNGMRSYGRWGWMHHGMSPEGWREWRRGGTPPFAPGGENSVGGDSR